MHEIAQNFQQELQATYGTAGGVDYSSQIECIDGSYKFLQFERVINKKRKEYKDASTKENIDKLNQELVDVKNIMTQSFEMLLNRDKNLNKLSELGKNLSQDSAKMKKEARNLKFSYFLKQYMTYIVVLLVFLFLIFMKLYVFWKGDWTIELKWAYL